jgi:hypothetical protein
MSCRKAPDLRPGGGTPGRVRAIQADRSIAVQHQIQFKVGFADFLTLLLRKKQCPRCMPSACSSMPPTSGASPQTNQCWRPAKALSPRKLRNGSEAACNSRGRGYNSISGNNLSRAEKPQKLLHVTPGVVGSRPVILVEITNYARRKVSRFLIDRGLGSLSVVGRVGRIEPRRFVTVCVTALDHFLAWPRHAPILQRGMASGSHIDGAVQSRVVVWGLKSHHSWRVASDRLRWP